MTMAVVPPSNQYAFSPATMTEYVPMTKSTSATLHESVIAAARTMSLRM